jgi:hypothetical protein
MVAVVVLVGYRTGAGLSVTAGTTYTITVGGGGTAGGSARPSTGGTGGDSSIAGAPITENPSGAGTNTLKAYGGGFGSGYRNPGLNAGNGGSGGGAGGYDGTGSGSTSGPGTAGTANTGGGGGGSGTNGVVGAAGGSGIVIIKYTI